MRKIKFRGKALTGEGGWVYGYFVPSDDGYAVVPQQAYPIFRMIMEVSI